MSWAYQAPWWLPGGNLQTIYAAKLVRAGEGENPVWIRQRWKTPDGDFIDVDERSDTSANLGQNAPLLVMFHGLEGSSQSHYAQAFARATQKKGWRMLIPHFRGCGGDINHAPRAYHSGDYAEIAWILERIRKHNPCDIHVVGISLGGNALMKWAGEMGSDAQQVVQTAASVCSPVDLTASGNAIDSGFNKVVYARMFLSTMKIKAIEKLKQYPGLFDIEALMAATTLYQFDDIFTAPLHGFKNTADYWDRASAKQGLRYVRIPALVLNARNDPFIPSQSLPTKSQVSESVTLWQPEHGGHVGFVSGNFPGHINDMPEAVLDWMQQHG